MGDQQDYGMRIYDPRVGRFLSADPITSKFPWYTPYQFAGDKPIWANDLDGLEENTTSTYVKPPTVILSSLRPTFKGIITITDETSGKAHNTFQGTYQQLQKADQSRLALQILYVLTGPDPGKSTDRLNITIDNLPQKQRVDKNAESVDIDYYQHYSFTRTNKDHFVSQSGTFDVKVGSVSNGSNSTAATIALTELNIFGPALTGLSKLIDEAPVVNVTGRAALNDFKGRAGIYIHEFQSGTVYVGQSIDLGARPWQSLRELVDATGKYKGTAAMAGDVYSGTTRIIPLEGSGFSSLKELESSAINHYGGTISEGGSTYNIKKINP